MKRVASLLQLVEMQPFAVDLDGKALLLVRDGPRVHAFQGTCPHAGAPLAEGAVCGRRLVCPWHKAVFSLDDGRVLEPPALLRLARYDVETRGADLFVGAAVPPATLERAGRERTFLVVGGGAAGAAAVAAMREGGWTERIVLVSDEAAAPYDRTALSKFVVAGAMPAEEVPPLLPPDFYDQRKVERLRGRVVQLSPARRQAELADGTRLHFDAALVAPGGTPNRPKMPGADLPGVHVLRSRANAASLVAALQPGAKVVVLGGSFIGLEAACGLRERGLETVVVSPEAIPFAGTLGPKVGGMIRDLHVSHGVRFAHGKAARIEGEAHVRAVALEDGTSLAADVVLVGLGVRPATGFLDLPLREDGGVVVDSGMRAADGVFVAGDAAAFPFAGQIARIEHWRVAQQHARVAVINMLGGSAVYDGVPFFWTYHYGKRIEVLGHATEWDETVIDGDLAGAFIAFLARRGELQAVVACQREQQMARLSEAMRAILRLSEARRL